MYFMAVVLHCVFYMPKRSPSNSNGICLVVWFSFFVVVVFVGEKITWIDEQSWRTGNFSPNIVVGFCPCTVLFILAHQ